MKIKTVIGLVFIFMAIMLLASLPEPDTAFALGPNPRRENPLDDLPLLEVALVLSCVGIFLVRPKEKQ